MKGHKRNYHPDAYQHIFQHAIGYRVLFYSMEDRLVFYSIFSVMAWRHGIEVLALALMYNHFHALIHAPSSKVMSLFIGTTTSTFAMAFNRDSHRKGALFEKAYGSAPKSADKKVRSCIAYIYNNSVEKALYTRAEDDRWNFLAYIGKEHPFSRPIKMESAPKKLRSAVREIDARHTDHAYLSYATVRRLFGKLTEAEREQLLDYTIGRYLPIDKNQLLSFYKDYDNMLLAINSNTGSEYDIKEEYKNDSDQIYTQMLAIIGESSYSHKPHSVVCASEEKKAKIASYLKSHTSAKDYQISRILHFDGWPVNR